MKKFIFFFFAIASLLACKTDFEVNAPHDKTPIVYGIIEATTDTQFIKINRTFLGTNNVGYSAINDSTLFKNVNAKVEQYTNGTLGNVYTLQEMWVKNIDQGIFYSDSQKVYYFVEPNLNNNSVYKIVVTADGKDFSGETKMIQPFSFSNTFNISTLNGVSLAGDIGVYSTLTPKWNSGYEGKRYDLSLRFYYTEYKGSTITNKEIYWFLGSQKVLNSGNITTLSLPLNGESFYQFLGNNKELQNVTGVTKRVVKGVNIIVTAANETFNTYMEVNKPVSSIVTERPEYTNIKNGYGIFASRLKLDLGLKPLTEKSVKELAGGQYTGGMLFCSDSVAYTGKTYYCP